MNLFQVQQEEIISKDIFRAYDIRGIYDKTLTADHMYQIGLAIGSEIRQRNLSQVVTGRDGRNSSPILSLALQQGLLASGCDVIDIGAVPTPLVYFATHILPVNSGVMLTGSHNPAEYNGVKIVLDGKTLTEQEIQTLYQRIAQQDFYYGNGSLTADDVIERYIDYIANNIQINQQLKIVIDCANGIASEIAPALFRRLGCEVIELFCTVDGDFPNHEPDPSQPKNLTALVHAVKKHQADVGLAFDGDADRLGVVTNRGEVILPDRQMMLYAKTILQAQPNTKIIFDIKCSRHLPEVIRQYQGEPIMWKTGHSLIKAKMYENEATFAGEMSGHMFFNDRWFGFDDGLYTGVRLLEIIANDGRTISDIFAEFPDSVNTPEIKLPISEAEKFSFMDRFIARAKFGDAKITDIDGIRVDFTDGWGLLRPSNTTPCLILRFEAKDVTTLELIKTAFRKQLLAMDAGIVITF